MILCEGELELLTTRNSIKPVFSSVTAGFSGNVTGVAWIGGSGEEDGEDVRAFLDLEEDASSEAFLLIVSSAMLEV